MVEDIPLYACINQVYTAVLLTNERMCTKILLYVQWTAACFGQLYGQLQENKVQSLDILKV